jgi:hypothetical protein
VEESQSTESSYRKELIESMINLNNPNDTSLFIDLSLSTCLVLHEPLRTFSIEDIQDEINRFLFGGKRLLMEIIKIVSIKKFSPEFNESQFYLLQPSDVNKTPIS